MCMLSRRLQILIDEERYDRIAEQARARGVSVASLIREAVDRAFPPGDERRALAARRILSAEPMDVPDPPELKEELDDLRGRRSSSKPSAWISQWMRLSHGVDEHRCIEHYHLRRPLRSSSSSFSSGGSGTSIGSADKILRAAKARLSSPGGKARSTASRMSEATETPRALACSAIRS